MGDSHEEHLRLAARVQEVLDSLSVYRSNGVAKNLSPEDAGLILDWIEHLWDAAARGAKGSPKMGHDPVNSPSHYASTAVQPIDAIEAWGLGFCTGNAVKYIARHGKKDGEDPVQDLKKASWYLLREIARLERKEG